MKYRWPHVLRFEQGRWTLEHIELGPNDKIEVWEWGEKRNEPGGWIRATWIGLKDESDQRPVIKTYNGERQVYPDDLLRWPEDGARWRCLAHGADSQLEASAADIGGTHGEGG